MTLYWVVRVLLHQPSGADLWTYATTEPVVDAGAIVMLHDGSICEPVESFDTEAEAFARRALLASEMPGADFRVTRALAVTI